MKKLLYNFCVVFFICWCVYSSLRESGFFGNSTYGYYNNVYVRILKISNQRALISPSSTQGIMFTSDKNNIWVDLKDINFGGIE